MKYFDIKYLISEKFFYILSTGFALLSNFFIVIFSTKLLSQESYGYIALMKPLIIVFGSLFSLGLSPAFIQWRWKPNTNLKDLILTTLSVQYLSSIFYSIAVIFSLMIIFSDSEFFVSLNLIIAIFILCFTFLQNNELIHIYRVENKKDEFFLYSTIRSLSQMLLIVSTIFLKRDALSYLYGFSISELLIFIFLSRLKLKFFINKNLFFTLIKFGLPNALIISSTFLLNFADRFMINYYLQDITKTAIYDIGYVISSSLIGLISRPSNLYIQPKVTKLNYEKGIYIAKNELYKFQYTLLALLIIISLFIIISKDLIISNIFDINYLDSSIVVVPIVFSYLIHALFIPYITYLHILKKTNLIAFSTIISFLINIILNIFLIPKYGILGAADATLCSSLLQLFSLAFFAKEYRIGKSFYLILLVILFVYFISSL